jgi:diaminopimelate epimerase
MKFTKMQGAGNDYVYVNCFEERVENPGQLAIRVSNRNFGIGSDGLILILPSEKADVRMRMFNSDGSESEMCGNGVRCVAKYAYDHGLVSKKEITAETGAGFLTLQLFTDSGNLVDKVRVNMGVPRLTRAEIPMQGNGPDRVVAEPLNIMHTEFTITCVSMGNPHCVIFVDDVERGGKIRPAHRKPRYLPAPHQRGVCAGNLAWRSQAEDLGTGGGGDTRMRHRSECCLRCRGIERID